MSWCKFQRNFYPMAAATGRFPVTFSIATCVFLPLFMLRVGFGFRTQVFLCSVPSSCVCEAQLKYNWLLDALMSVLIC